jgi:hypothetical protein
MYRGHRWVGAIAATTTALALVALPVAAQAHDPAAAGGGVVIGPLLGPAGEAVKNILGLGGFFDDLNVIPGNDVPVSGGPDRLGEFGTPFVEPDIEGIATDAKCVADAQGYKHCKPAAGTMNVLPDGRILYWDALEGTENNRFSIVAEGGTTFTNDQTRLLDLAKRTWQRPEPVKGGANPAGADASQSDPLIPGLQSKESYNDGALFGSHQTYLADGRILVQGGTDYSGDPAVPGTRFGVVELGGLKATRIFDPATNRFTQAADTQNGRWYPTLVPLSDGRVLDVGGVRKLLKPVYLDKPQDSLRNVLQTETFDPKTGHWTGNGKGGERSLPLYPRLHLLPDGKVFYNTGGQSFNPVGEAFDQPSWNVPAVYDPARRLWSPIRGATLANKLTEFRGSTFSTMLMLQPDGDGRYERASFLTGGGVLGLVAATSPGSYLPTRASKITTVDTSGGQDRMSVRRTGPLDQPRWFSSGTLLPDGQVLITSGGDKDEVVLPGTERAVQQAELFDPARNAYRPLARQHMPRTYHNTAALLPSGEVLVGGHAPISTLYLNNTTLPGGFAPHDGRDPSFEVYKPPYLFRGPQPKIRKVRSKVGYGKTFGVRTDLPSEDIDGAVLIRFPSVTHLVDGGQRGIELPVRARRGRKLLLVKAPPDGAVAPPGPYMLFVLRRTAQGPVPSAARTVMLG